MAKIMLRASAPGVQNHAAWFLAVHAMSQGKPVEAHDYLCAGGCDNRLKLFPLFPFEIADDPQLVRIAVAARHLRRPGPRQAMLDAVDLALMHRCKPSVYSWHPYPALTGAA